MTIKKNLFLCIGLLCLSIFAYSQQPAKPLVETESGDYFGTDYRYGIILPSPDGTCYRIRILNGGTVITEPVTCPGGSGPGPGGPLISRIFGFAAVAGVTGGTNVVVVSNLAQLKAAVSAGGNYVKIAPSLAGGYIELRTGDNLYFGNSTTLDGSDAPGFELRVLPDSKTSADKVHAILLNNGNCIVHGITIKGFYNGTNGDSSAGIFGRTGVGYWIDHVTITGLDDDGIAFGDANLANSANKVTVSYCHIYNTDKAVLLTHSGTSPQGNPKGFTFAYNKLTGNIRDRIPVADGVQDFHWFNNYVHDTNGLYAEIGKFHAGGPQTAALFENNYYINQGGSAGAYAIQEKTGQGSWSGISWLYHNGLNSEGNNVNGQLVIGTNLLPKTSNLGPGVTIPYTYNLLPANSVPAYVNANAGAN